MMKERGKNLRMGKGDRREMEGWEDGKIKDGTTIEGSKKGCNGPGKKGVKKEEAWGEKGLGKNKNIGNEFGGTRDRFFPSLDIFKLMRLNFILCFRI